MRNDVYKIAICFSDKGRRVIERLNEAAGKAGITGVEAFICQDTDSTSGDFSGSADLPEGFSHISLRDFTRRGFEKKFAMIFVGAVGIAVRAISGCVKDKLSDSPVIVIDDNGTFVIPILSGHAGGANKLAVIIAHLLDAVPVITTSTDVNGAFSADVFAKENNLRIRNRKGIKKVSAKAIEGKNITLSVKDYPPTEKVNIILADETDREYDLLLFPKRFTIGIGTKKGKDPEEAEEFILKVLSQNGIEIDDVYAVATVSIKEDEPAVRDFARGHALPLISFEASVLEKAEGDFTPSEFVRATTGVDNVCERAAFLAAGEGAKLVCRKTAGEGITVAVAQRRLNG